MNRSLCKSLVLAVLALGASSIAACAQTLKADYQFQNDLTSAVAGAPDLVPVGTGSASFVTETVDGQSRTVYNFTNPSGLAATTTGVISSDNYSIVLLAQITPAFLESPISKLIDFKSLTSDAGFYSDATTTGLVSFYDGAGMVTASGGSLNVGQYAQLVLTRDGATDQVTGYSNGVQAFTFTDTTDLAVIDDPNSANEVLNFFIDDGVGLPIGENPDGSVARLRFYEGALSATQVTGLDRLPEVPAPSSALVFLTGGIVPLGIALRRRRK